MTDEEIAQELLDKESAMLQQKEMKETKNTPEL